MPYARASRSLSSMAEEDSTGEQTVGEASGEEVLVSRKSPVEKSEADGEGEGCGFTTWPMENDTQ